MAGPVRSLPKNTNRIESKGAGTVAFLHSERLTFGSTCTFASIDFCVWQLPEYDSDAEVLFFRIQQTEGIAKMRNKGGGGLVKETSVT